MSIILKGFCDFILQVMLLLSILFLLRGHNYPGGGFIGALIASAGLGMYILAHRRKPNITHTHIMTLLILGVILFLLSIAMGVFKNAFMLSAVWVELYIPGTAIKFGSPILFDMGIYFAVLGSIIWMIMELE